MDQQYGIEHQRNHSIDGYLAEMSCYLEYFLFAHTQSAKWPEVHANKFLDGNSMFPWRDCVVTSVH